MVSSTMPWLSSPLTVNVGHPDVMARRTEITISMVQELKDRRTVDLIVEFRGFRKNVTFRQLPTMRYDCEREVVLALVRKWVR